MFLHAAECLQANDSATQSRYQAGPLPASEYSWESNCVARPYPTLGLNC